MRRIHSLYLSLYKIILNNLNSSNNIVSIKSFIKIEFFFDR